MGIEKGMRVAIPRGTGFTEVVGGVQRFQRRPAEAFGVITHIVGREAGIALEEGTHAVALVEMLVEAEEERVDWMCARCGSANTATLNEIERAGWRIESAENPEDALAEDLCPTCFAFRCRGVTV